jgi:tetratricopeptide (TPR) repeat protein
MPSVRIALVCLLLALASITSYAQAQDSSLLPKYGGVSKTEAQRAADAKFLQAVDAQFGANRTKAAEDIAARGWTILRQGNAKDAMRRFNQAWLLDPANGAALWGMAAILGGDGNANESLKLFAEAGRYLGDDIDFSVDYARTLGMAGTESNNDVYLRDALARFERNYARAPQHVLNLQNWAITLFYMGKYAEAWKKIQLAEAAPRRSELDANFVAALQAKMPRP